MFIPRDVWRRRVGEDGGEAGEFENSSDRAGEMFDT
jgi:hypothetical protein